MAILQATFQGGLKMLYFAYGSNLNLAQMKDRCPRAIPLGNFYLRNARLVFRGVADCVYLPGATCPGAIWSITSECEKSLDRYEGYRPLTPGQGLYCKEIVEICNDDGEVSAELMVYRMNSTGIFPPSQAYLDSIVEGYRNFRLPLKRLRAAVRRSYDRKAPSEIETRRYQKKGFPQLAARP